jgi:hypothetical protein
MEGAVAGTRGRWINLEFVTRPRRPAPPPLEGNDQMVTAVITAGWAVALIVVLILRESIPSADRWWIWTCAAGLGLGIFGLWYVPVLKRSRARAAQRRAARPAG